MWTIQKRRRQAKWLTDSSWKLNELQDLACTRKQIPLSCDRLSQIYEVFLSVFIIARMLGFSSLAWKGPNGFLIGKVLNGRFQVAPSRLFGGKHATSGDFYVFCARIEREGRHWTDSWGINVSYNLKLKPSNVRLTIAKFAPLVGEVTWRRAMKLGLISSQGETTHPLTCSQSPRRVSALLPSW